MADLGKRLIIRAALLYAIVPATGVSADKVANDFSDDCSDGKGTVVVVEGKGRTVGKGNWGIELGGGQSETPIKVTGGSTTVTPVAGLGGLPTQLFQQSPPLVFDQHAVNDAYDFARVISGGLLVVRYGILDELQISGMVNVLQNTYKAAGRAGLPSGEFRSDILAFGGELMWVPLQYQNGLYLAGLFSARGCSYKNQHVSGGSPAARGDLSWLESAAAAELGFKSGKFTPYFGVRYSKLDIEMRLTDSSNGLDASLEFGEKEPVQFYGGLQLYLGNNLSVNGNFHLDRSKGRGLYVGACKRF